MRKPSEFYGAIRRGLEEAGGSVPPIPLPGLEGAALGPRAAKSLLQLPRGSRGPSAHFLLF